MQLAAQVIDGLFRDELFECPLVNTRRCLFVELIDILYGACKDLAFVLLAAWYMLCKFVDAFVDGLSSTTLNYPVLVPEQRVYSR